MQDLTTLMRFIVKKAFLFALLVSALFLSLAELLKAQTPPIKVQSEQEKQDILTLRQKLLPETINKTSDEILFERLQSLLSSVNLAVSKGALKNYEKSSSHRIIELAWEAYPGAPRKFKAHEEQYEKGTKLTLSQDTKLPNGVMQDVGLQVADNLLFVAAVDDQAQLRWYTQVEDPRISREEWVKPDGEYAGDEFRIANPKLTLTIPDDPEIKEFRLYEFKMDGGVAGLQLINSLHL